MYEKEFLEILSDKYDKELDEIPETLEFEYEETNYACPDCSAKLFRVYVTARNNEEIDVYSEVLYCKSCKKYYYENDIIWRANNGGGGSGGGSNVKMVGQVLTIT